MQIPFPGQIENSIASGLSAMYRTRASILLLIIFLPSLGTSLSAQSFQLVSDPKNKGNSRGCSWADINQDGWVDLYVSNRDKGGADQSDYIFMNRNGVFTFQTVDSLPFKNILAESIASIAAIWADYDNDDDVDLFLASGRWDEKNVLFPQKEGIYVRDTPIGLIKDKIDSRGAAWGDYDRDGFLDLAVANLTLDSAGCAAVVKNGVFHNEGNGEFTFINTRDSSFSVGCNWIDVNLDGEMELFFTRTIAIPDAPCPQSLPYNQNILFHYNSSLNSFSPISAGDLTSDTFRSEGAAWADFDNDGDLDVYVGAKGDPTFYNYLYINDAFNRLGFTRIDSAYTGTKGGGDIANYKVSSHGGSWADVNNDGYLDLFVVNYGKNQLFMNSGPPNYTLDLIPSILSDLVGADTVTISGIWADYDHDGDLDLFVCNSGPLQVLGEGKNFLYKNLNNNGNHWLSLDLVGTCSNRSAVGAIIYLEATISDSIIEQTRYISTQTTINSHDDLKVHFGLGDADIADINHLIVKWSSGIIDTIYPAKVDTNLIIIESGGNTPKIDTCFIDNVTSRFVDLNAEILTGNIWASAYFEWWEDKDTTRFNLWDFGRKDSQEIQIPISIDSLDPNTKYYYRIVAKNELGSAIWEDTFRTRPILFSESIFYPNDKSVSIMSTWPDFDNDGDLDLFVVNTGLNGAGASNYFYENIGDGNFNKIPSGEIVTASEPSVGASWGDINNDGNIDVLVINDANNNPIPNSLYQNLGKDSSYNFSKMDFGLNDRSFGLSWADIDNDGDLDMVTSNREDTAYSKIWLNQDDSFSKDNRINLDQGISVGVSWADIDNDNDQDLFIANGGFESRKKNYLYINRTENSVIDLLRWNVGALPNESKKSQGGVWGDYDNDGDLDLYVVDRDSFDTGSVWINEYTQKDSPIFKLMDTDSISGINTDWAPSQTANWIDYDLDGDLDLFVVNDTGYANFLYVNQGYPDYQFRKDTVSVLTKIPGDLRGNSWGDMDKDGDLDIFIADANRAEPNHLFINHASERLEHHWISFQLTGTVSNRSSIGAKVRIKAKVFGNSYWQMRELTAQSGLASQNSLWASFGLGNASTIDSVQVIWPSGTSWDTTKVEANKFILKTEPAPIPQFDGIDHPNCINIPTEEAVSIVARVKDLSSASQMIFHYRPISDTAGMAWKQDTIEANSSSEFFGYVPKSAFLDSNDTLKDNIGVVYYFEAVNANNVKVSSDSGFVYIYYEASYLTISGLKTGKTTKDYQIISIPLELGSTKVSDIFGTPNKKDWRLFYVDNTGSIDATKLLEYRNREPNFTDLARGKSYWYISKEESSLNISSAGSTILDDHRHYSIPLKMGWNQIGNPFNFNLWWPDVVAYNNSLANLQFFIFDSGWKAADRERFLKFSGGLVHSDIDFTLQIPTIKNLNVQIERRRPQYFYDPTLFLQDSAWFMPLSLSKGEDSIDIGGIGVHPKASLSRDHLDRITPPRFFDYLEINFLHPEFFSPRFSVDVVPEQDHHIWSFQLESNQELEITTLSWPRPEIKYSRNRLILMDIEEQKTLDMEENSAYRFSMKKGTYQFQIYYGPESFLQENLLPERIHVGKLFPNPSNGNIIIPLALPKSLNPYQIEVKVLDITGKEYFRSIENGYPEGFSQLPLTLTYGNANPLPVGLYLVQVSVINIDDIQISTQKLLIN